jgi:hypothetical protein
MDRRPPDLALLRAQAMMARPAAEMVEVEAAMVGDAAVAVIHRATSNKRAR